MHCSNCTNLINTNHAIYRGFDMNFCSVECRSCFEMAIIKIDPTITKFKEWANISNTNTTPVPTISKSTSLFKLANIIHYSNSEPILTHSVLDNDIQFESYELSNITNSCIIDLKDIKLCENSNANTTMTKSRSDNTIMNRDMYKIVNNKKYGNTYNNAIDDIYNYSTSCTIKIIDIINNSVTFLYNKT
jgi:hypothetical protein